MSPARRRWTPAQPPSEAPRWLAWPLAALALLVLWLALNLGLRPLLGMLALHRQAQTWVPVQAQVTELKLVQRRKSDDLQVRYRYEFQGSPLEAARLGVAPPGEPGDNAFVHWQYQRLEQAQQSGRSVMAWVDPKAPERALLDRELPLNRLLLILPLALGFTLFGLGLAVVAWRVWRGPEATKGTEAQAAERAHAQRNAFVWGFALVWCSMAFPISALMWRGGPDFVSGLFMLLFNGIGLWLLWAAWVDRPRRPGPPTWPWLVGLAVCLWGMVRYFS